VLPVVVRRLSRRALVPALVAAVLLAPVLRVVLTRLVGQAMPAFVLPFCRADALALGGLCALLGEERRLRHWAAPALLLSLASCGYMIATGQSVGSLYSLALGHTLFAVGAAALLWLGLRGDGAWARLLRVWPLRAIGRISYGVYLFHMIGLAVSRRFLGVPERIHGLRDAAFAVAVPLAVTLLAAFASYQLVERRLIAFAQRRTT
jgi:peptidoglycan/LPS O-acetylase OafA/YrhL